MSDSRLPALGLQQVPVSPVRLLEPARSGGIAAGALDRLYRDLYVDDEWAVREPCRFEWWASRHRTVAWAEPEFEEFDLTVARLHVATDFVRGARTDPKTDAVLAGVARFASLFAIVRDEADPSRLRLRSSMYVTSGGETGAVRMLATAAALQSAEAFDKAALLAELVGGEPDTSAHPRSGSRVAADDLLNLPAKFAAESGPSRWTGREVTRALQTLKGLSFRASRNEAGFTAKFPFFDYTSLLEVVPDEVHPSLGPGLLCLLHLHGDPAGADRATAVAQLNRLELARLTRSWFLGSWCHGEAGPSFASFFPSALAGANQLTNIAISFATRAKWLAESAFQPAPARPVRLVEV